MTNQVSTSTIERAADEFLACHRIAVTGVSHAPRGHGSNAVYGRLQDRGYDVFAVNPNAPRVPVPNQARDVGGDATYPDLASIPGGVDAVVIGTRPERAEATMAEVVQLGIDKVWMHRAFGSGSVSPGAAAYGREHGVKVIDGGCPLMFGPTSDRGHKMICPILKLTGKVPRTV
jgi:predicted CoA-binding protein